MFHPLPIYIGLRYLGGRSGDKFGRFVSYMSTAGITIGVMALVTVLGVMNGFEHQLKARILGVLPHAVVATADDYSLQQAALSDWEHVIASAPLLQTDAVIQSSAAIGAGRLLGVDPMQNEPIKSFIVMGSAQLEAGQYQVLLGSDLARSLGVMLGDKVRVMITESSRFTPLGRMPVQRNFTVIGIFDTATDVDGQLFYTHISDLGRLMRITSPQSYQLRLFVSDPFLVAELATKAKQHGLAWSDWRALRGQLFQAVKMEKNMMGLMLSLIILVAAFNIISALIMVVMEKQAEVAILKTQGMRWQSIVSIFMVQGASSGVIGAVLGGALGTLLCLNINQVLALFHVNLLGGAQSLPVVLNMSDVLTVVLSAIGLSFLATLFPSLKAAAVAPANTLRYE